MIIDFWKVIYFFYLKTTKNQEISKIQSVGVVSLHLLFITNFLTSIIFYAFNIKLSKIGNTAFVIANLVVFFIFFSLNYAYFVANFKKISIQSSRGKLFTILIHGIEITFFALGLVSALLYKKANGF